MVSKKIIIVLYSFELGGAERQAFYLAKYLKDVESVNVEVWGIGTNGPVIDLCNSYNIKWRFYDFAWVSGYVVGGFYFFKQLLSFLFLLRKNKPDIIISYTSLPNLICSLVWRFTKARLFIWQQRDEGVNRPPKLLEKLAVINTPFFVANSQASVNFLKNTLYVKEDKITIIHNGIALVNLKLMQEDWCKKLNVTRDYFIAIMVANLHKNKDHETLLKAWKLVVVDESLKSIQKKLILVGRKDDKAKTLEELCYSLNLQNEVIFTGFVDDVHGILNIASLCVFSSISEGFPNGIIEAMAVGLPVVGTNIPGIREAVGESNYQYLCKPKDPFDMYNKIKLFVNNKDLSESTGYENKRYVYDNFILDQMCTRNVWLIERLLGKQA